MRQRRFEEAAAAFEAATERSTTWVGQQSIYLVGDCWLEAGRFSDALTSYVRRRSTRLRAPGHLNAELSDRRSRGVVGRARTPSRKRFGRSAWRTRSPRRSGPYGTCIPPGAARSPRTWIPRGRRSAMPPPTQPMRRVVRCRATERSRRSSRFRSRPQSPENAPGSLWREAGNHVAWKAIAAAGLLPSTHVGAGRGQAAARASGPPCQSRRDRSALAPLRGRRVSFPHPSSVTAQPTAVGTKRQAKSARTHFKRRRSGHRASSWREIEAAALSRVQPPVSSQMRSA